MASFRDMVTAPPGSKFILQGNAAFALGVAQAGYHAATGYPGTPSTEVIDKSLVKIQDRMKVGWSVNEAVAVSTGLGHSLAGQDAVVTMKIPGVFQAADALTTTAFFAGKAGALVILAVTDYIPSSTQHVIDARYFFSSSRLPVLEPRSHQEWYEMAWLAADLSRRFQTPVIILVSSILAHSEALIITRQPRTVIPQELPENLHAWMNMPSIARANYNKVMQERIPAFKAWGETSELITAYYGTEEWGVIVNGAAELILREALNQVGADPSILSIALSYPLPESKIREFAHYIKGKIFIIEDGDRYLEEKIRLLNINVIGKDETCTITNWTPDEALKFLSGYIDLPYKPVLREVPIRPLPRPPSICPGCTYRGFALAAAKLKRRKKLFAAFGDIGCSTLLFFLDALDTCSCMGASDSIRQGMVLSRPDLASRLVSVIGDSTECHTGLDSTRNAVFRNVPGVKVILDNRTTAMTGGQPAPSSPLNLEGQTHNFSLKRAVEAEGGRTVILDAFDLKKVEAELKAALKLADQGVFTTLILEGDCIHELDDEHLVRKLEFDYAKCRNCDLCNICPGIETDADKIPHFTSLCTNCGTGQPICLQRCPFDAIIWTDGKRLEETLPPPIAARLEPEAHPNLDSLPSSLRVAIRGVGGQGNLFFGKVLSEVALRTPYARSHIVKGETHGMAQLGGPVISTFSCGRVFSPIPVMNSVDALVTMEVSEMLRPGFLQLLKPGGVIIVNEFEALPINVGKEEYPSLQEIEKSLEGVKIIKINAQEIASEIGDKFRKTANVIVLGLLSTLKPFSLIPAGIWREAIGAVSPTESIQAINGRAFEAGRSFRYEI